MTEATPFVRPDTRMLLDMIKAIGAPQLHELSPVDSRAAYLAMVPIADVEPTELAVIRDLSFAGPAGDVALRYYDVRANRSAGPAIIFFHGGGFVIGNLDTHHPFCTEMARQLDLPVIAVDYRLAPEHPFPAAAEDCIAAARWLAASPAELGLTVTGLIPCGDSAGGNLAIVTTRELMARPATVPVIAQIPIYPLVTGSQDWESFRSFADGFFLTRDGMDWFGECYQQVDGHMHYECLDRDHAGTPPTVLATASLDPLRDQGRAYAAALISAGVSTSYYEAEGNIHGYICLRKGIPSSQADVDAILARAHTVIKELA